MPILPGRLIDNAKRFESTNWKIEVGQVEKTHMHNDPNDPDFVSVTVLIRDKRMLREGGENYHRIRIPVWQRFIGNRFGAPWMPRQGDFVYVAFFKNEKAFVVASAYNFQAKPTCMPGSDIDILNKICPWQEAKDRNPTNEFKSLPVGKKPTCQKWFHGPINKAAGTSLIGRDYMQVFDYCQEGDEDPTCQKCDSIDRPKRQKNTWHKVYSADTMSCVAPNHRVEDHVYCGSYLRYESECGNSEEYSEGCGHIRLGNAVCESCKKGHLNLDPKGSIDIHSVHEETDVCSESKGTRVIAYAPDSGGEIAVAMDDFESGSFVHILKNGEVIIHATKITLDSALTHNTEDVQTDGTCTHAGCSCPCCGV